MTDKAATPRPADQTTRLEKDPAAYAVFNNQHRRGMKRYLKNFDNLKFQIATRTTTTERANRLTDAAMALCGCPSYRMHYADKWTRSELIYLAAFSDEAPPIPPRDPHPLPRAMLDRGPRFLALSREKAAHVAYTLTANDPDGWKYCQVEHPSNERAAYIVAYSKTGEYLGTL